MTTTTYPFTVSAGSNAGSGTVAIAGTTATIAGQAATNHPNPVIREAAREYLANGTTAGTVTVTAT